MSDNRDRQARRDTHSQYVHRRTAPACSSAYLWGPLRRVLARELPAGGTVFDLGCGNGATVGMLMSAGYATVGIDPSASGVELARSMWPAGRFEIGSAYDDDLVERFGRFPAVISLEVVEHCYWPRRFSASVYDLLLPGGLAVISTPYHGYAKNLLLALTNRFDEHWSPLWDGGHIKFWSRRTLGRLLDEAGFADVAFIRAGRIPPLAKSLIALARKPTAGGDQIVGTP